MFAKSWVVCTSGLSVHKPSYSLLIISYLVLGKVSWVKKQEYSCKPSTPTNYSLIGGYLRPHKPGPVILRRAGWCGGLFVYQVETWGKMYLIKFVISLYYLCSVVHSDLIFVNMESDVFAITFDFHTLNFRKKGFENLKKICKYVFWNSAGILRKLTKNFETEDSN